MIEAMRAPLIVCLTGAECSGKTTLAEALAQHYQAPLAMEAARAYLNARQGAYGPQDLLAIARQQVRQERAAVERALGQAASAADPGQPPPVLCDTDLLVIRIWWEVKYGAVPEELQRLMAERSPRAYLLAKPDIPWAPDPLRESGGDRAALHRLHQAALADSGCPYVELGGDLSSRLAAAQSHIDRWLSRGLHPRQGG